MPIGGAGALVGNDTGMHIDGRGSEKLRISVSSVISDGGLIGTGGKTGSMVAVCAVTCTTVSNTAKRVRMRFKAKEI